MFRQRAHNIANTAFVLRRNVCTVPTLINGAARLDGQAFEVKNSPTDGAEICKVRSSSIEECIEAVDAAVAAAPSWGSIKLEDKRDILAGTKSALSKDKSDLIDAMSAEVGIPIPVAEAFTQITISLFDGAIGALQDTAVVHPPVVGRTPMVFREPVGPVLSIAPWNAPGPLGLRAMLYPIAAGCPVVFKSSIESPLSHYTVADAFKKGGLPPGVLNFINPSQDDTIAAVRSMIEHPGIRKINFTGSSKVGRDVAVCAAENLKPILLELGGKTGVFVHWDADLRAAAKEVVFGGWANAGQVCMSTDRVFVSRDVYDQFLVYLKDEASSLSSTPICEQPQVNSRIADTVETQVQDALSKGASMIWGRASRQGNLIGKCILGDVSPDMDIYDTETFGPVFYVTPVESTEEAIGLMNSSKFGLNCSIWTREISRGIALAKKLEAGQVHINGQAIFDQGPVPHGGVKGSGYGRFGGIHGIEEFTTVKAITWPQ